MKVRDIKFNPDNPRDISEEALEKLKTNIEQFPKMMALRPMVIDENNMVLGGNQRLAALVAMGYEEIPNTWVKKAATLTEEEKRRFIILDNVSFGEWNWTAVSKQWDKAELLEWGVDLPPWVGTDFSPSITPTIDTAEITDEDLRREEERLDNQMIRETIVIDVACPNCGHEFSVNK